MNEFINKLKNDKGAGDLQMGLITTLFIIVVCISLVIDFWIASSAKVIIIKEVQGAELYQLVTSLKNGGGLQDPLLTGGQPHLVDMTHYQNMAVTGLRNELNPRLRNLPYVKDYNIALVEGLTQPIGEMGIRTRVNYRVKTMIRSPGQIFNFMQRERKIELDATEQLSLLVTT